MRRWLRGLSSLDEAPRGRPISVILFTMLAVPTGAGRPRLGHEIGLLPDDHTTWEVR